MKAVENTDSFLRSMLRVKASNLVVHIAGCLIFLFLPLLFPFGQSSDAGAWAIMLSPGYLFFYILFLATFYIHTYILIPKLFFSKQYFFYALVIVLLISVVYFSRPFDRLINTQNRQQNEFRQPGPPPFGAGRDNRFPPPPGPPGRPNGSGHRGGPRVDIISLFLLGTILTMGQAIQTGQLWRKTEQRAVQAEADKMNAELSFLKAQINPHFLFNTLNNLYSLAIINSEHTAESIMKLSNIMRYVTDENSQDFVSLQSEVDCIRDYIDLQKLRLSKKVELDVLFEGDFTHKKIAPLILMTFIENVFKYGISNHEKSDVKIHILAEKKTLSFYCRNTLFATPRQTGRSGIGISNTQKRLQHLYPNKHLLNISADSGFYTTELTVQL